MESRTKTNEVVGIDKDAIIIPEGFELVVVKVGNQENIEPSCPTCGGSSLHTAAACVYCGNGRTHYEYKKIGGEEVKKTSGQEKMSNKVIVEQGTMEGKISANEVRIEEGSVVGDIVGGDNVYLAEGAKAGFVYSPILRTERGVEISQAATTVFDYNGPVVIDVLTVYNTTSPDSVLNIATGSKINELRLGTGIEEPGMFERWGIKKITHGDFPVPKEWIK